MQKIKKVLAISKKLWYLIEVLGESKQNMVDWSIGQAVKTPPSHGGNRGSIPLSTAEKLLNFRSFFVVSEMSRHTAGYLTLRGNSLPYAIK